MLCGKIPQMKNTKNKPNGFFSTFIFSLFFSLLFATSVFLIIFYFPKQEPIEYPKNIINIEQSKPQYKTLKEALDLKSQTKPQDFDIDDYKNDRGLSLYRNSLSKKDVEIFYERVTNNSEVSNAILVNANKYSIPLSLAFALAYTESRYKPTAVNHNTNGSIDRGLFQLNSGSFPTLSEYEFFDPNISAKNGLSHLSFCLKNGGNTVTALAYYNAGHGKVKSNRTPQMTLSYINKIINYQKKLDEQFYNEVIVFYESLLLLEK